MASMPLDYRFDTLDSFGGGSSVFTAYTLASGVDPCIIFGKVAGILMLLEVSHQGVGHATT